MTTVETDFFSITLPSDIILWFESGVEKKTDVLLLSRNDGLEGNLELIAFNDPEELRYLCEQTIIDEVDSLSGYVDEIDSEYPNEIVTLFDYDNRSHAHRHFFRFEHCFALHLTLVKGYFEEDHRIAREILKSAIFKFDKWNKDVLERVDFSLLPNMNFDKVGNSRYLLRN